MFRGGRFSSGHGVHSSIITADAVFSMRQHIHVAMAYMLSAPYVIARLSVHLSVCLSHWCIIQKRLKLGLRNFHYMADPSLYFLRGKFHQKFLTGFPQKGASNIRQGGKNKPIFSFKRQYLENGKG